MKFSEYIEQFDGVDMSEAYIRFLIDNHDKYVIVSIRTDGVVHMGLHNTKDEFAQSLLRHISRIDSNGYVFKRSDVDKFMRSGTDIIKIMSRSGEGKEVAKKIRKELKQGG